MRENTVDSDPSDAITKTAAFVQQEMAGDGSGHDWWHAWRVWQLAKRIGAEEKADMLTVELAALLHDIDDWKFIKGDAKTGPWLHTLGLDDDVVAHVLDIVNTLSYKGAGVPTPMKTTEGKTVQDADRLDGIGAIGVARCFAYGGGKGRLLWDPGVTPVMHGTAQEYMAASKDAGGNSINHFHEKLLLLKDRMNTATGKRLAEGRHAFMLRFLEEFHAEWDGRR